MWARAFEAAPVEPTAVAEPRSNAPLTELVGLEEEKGAEVKGLVVIVVPVSS